MLSTIKKKNKENVLLIAYFAYICRYGCMIMCKFSDYFNNCKLYNSLKYKLKKRKIYY